MKIETKKLRASFVIENSIIIPFFTIIIVILMTLCLYLHDSSIIKNALVQSIVILEKSCADDAELQKEKEQELKKRAEEYILEKTVLLQSTKIVFTISDRQIKAEGYAQFKLTQILKAGEMVHFKEQMDKTSPPDYIRKLRAVKKAADL